MFLSRANGLFFYLEIDVSARYLQKSKGSLTIFIRDQERRASMRTLDSV